MKKLTIFLSAASDELHHQTDLEGNLVQPLFYSYREILEKGLHEMISSLKCNVKLEIITQDRSFEKESGDLLEILEKNVRSSDYVVHLIGHLPGAKPETSQLRRFSERNECFLSNHPECRENLSSTEDISFTQWESYIALDDRPDSSASRKLETLLLYDIQNEAPRSPRCAEIMYNQDVKKSMSRHAKLLQASGLLRHSVRNQDHLTTLVYQSLLNQGALRDSNFLGSSQELIKHARDSIGVIVKQMVKYIKSPKDKKLSNPKEVNVWHSAIQASSEEYDIQPDEMSNLLEEFSNEKQQESEEHSDPQSIYEYAMYLFSSCKYAEALKIVKECAQRASQLKQISLTVKSWRLYYDASIQLGNAEQAIFGLEQASPMITLKKNPSLWMDVHSDLASLYINHYHIGKNYLNKAYEILLADDGIFDQAEILYGKENIEDENSIELAEILMLTCKYYKETKQFHLIPSIAKRAQSNFPLNYSRYTAALTVEAMSLEELASSSQSSRYEMAEKLYRDALEIDIVNYGADHPQIATKCNNLAGCLGRLGHYIEAEKLYRRALAIDNKAVNPYFPDVAKHHSNLAYLLEKKQQFDEAEKHWLSAHQIHKNIYDPTHPQLASGINNLAGFYLNTNQLEKAAQYFKYQLVICMQNSLSMNEHHPGLKTSIESYCAILQQTGHSIKEIKSKVVAFGSEVGWDEGSWRMKIFEAIGIR